MARRTDFQHGSTSFFNALKKIQGTLFVVLAKVLFAEFLLAAVFWFSPYREWIKGGFSPLGEDFINVYAAGILVNQGIPGAVYDIILHGQAEIAAVAGQAIRYRAWHYPPIFLLIASFCALFPYALALVLYLGMGIAAYWKTMRSIAPRTKEAFWLIAAFPGAYINIFNGQNGFITAALFGCGMLFLESRPVLAGAAFGFLSYKPQLFIFIPLFLAIGGHRKALFSALAVFLLCAVLSWAHYGVQIWMDFFNGLAVTRRDILEEGWAGWDRIQSIMSAVRMWGGSASWAYLLQGIAALAALSLAAWVWRTKASFDVRVAVLTAAIAVATPYIMDYDLTILIVPIVFWVRKAVKEGFCLPEKIIYGMLWILPAIARQATMHGVPLAQLALMALICLSFIRARQSLQIKKRL